VPSVRWVTVVILLVFGLLSIALFSASASNDVAQYYGNNSNDGTLRRIHVPILMYHYVSPLPQDADEYRVDLTVTPGAFRAHIQYLYDEGYETISLRQLYDALTFGEALPARPVVLTFDDGYIDHYEHAFPILQEYDFTGTFFIITGRSDSGSPDYLNWSQIVEMAAAGMSMESHSKDHFDLRDRDREFLVYQVLGSIESLEAHTGQEVFAFCYPSGRYDDATLAVVEQSTALAAVTTQHGSYHTSSNMLELGRLRISGNVGTSSLARLLNPDG
jgi:peptidoglycan/xylan/chitin deacetylase (PgdA/CDA1 family)